MDLKKLKDIKLTQKQQTAIATVVMIVGFGGYAYWNYLYSPLVKKNKDKTVILQQKQKDLQDAKNMVSKYPEFLARASAINSETEYLNSRLPEKLSFAELIKEISDKAAASDVTIENFSPEKETKKGEYTEKRFRFTTRSGYANLGNLITGLGYSKMVIICDELKVRMDEDDIYAKNNIRTEMVLKIYNYPKAAEQK
ncbi:MAG TPA: type 4a pilus biogenesis protein PilO [Candidatus Goldiibacteriota bacterium]|nr:type 4a pilus biogenesis protein PilO [Candidatus Goldiibacteriota bacterium]HPN64175.1 type 4a pilus biogenesis protein PilO [Candidatus Goldiibacteriota bacterium]HRQ44410.1 type 4a pilus biogenesis protein PilO [Candidatus Goldiibacteriota bacterium]